MEEILAKNLIAQRKILTQFKSKEYSKLEQIILLWETSDRLKMKAF